MADGQKPEGSAPPPPPNGDASGKTEKPPGEAAKPAPPKPAAPAAHAAAPKAPPTMAAVPWESDLTARLKERFADAITEFSSYLDQNFLVARLAAVVPVLEFLKHEAEFDYLVDITAVDYPKRAERFDLFYILYSFNRNERIRVKAQAAEDAQPATATTVYRAANWLEREVFDMFGIRFSGHPDMRRILLPEEWEGYPLRKDYSIIQQDEKWVKENLGIESGQ